MTPEKVTIGTAELWHGDCRDVLPMLDSSVAIISDPPYGIGYVRGGGGRGCHALSDLADQGPYAGRLAGATYVRASELAGVAP